MFDITILTDNNKGFSSHEFEYKFLEICKNHRLKGQALAFAFILFDEKAPYVRKVLDDLELYDALDAYTGHTLSVFYFKIERKQKRSYNFNIPATRSSNSNGPFIEMIYGINATPFSIDITQDDLNIPSILFFQVDAESNVIDSFLIPLDDNKKDETYFEMKNIFSEATQSLKCITPENRDNCQEIFNLLKSNLEAKYACKIIFERLRNITDIISFIKSL